MQILGSVTCLGILLSPRFQNRPLTRLIPRKAVRGGKVSVMGLKWRKEDSPNTEFLCNDISSHYPAVMRENK